MLPGIQYAERIYVLYNFPIYLEHISKYKIVFKCKERMNAATLNISICILCKKMYF